MPTRSTKQKPTKPTSPTLATKLTLASAERSSKVPAGDFRFTSNMSRDLHYELKNYAVRNRRTMGDVIEDAIRAYIASPAK